jgi:hypothetical protein
MGFLHLFKAKPKTPFALEEKRFPVEFGHQQVRVKSLGKDIFLEDCLHHASKSKDLKITRFYLVNEHPWGLHYAPTLEKALDWFRGKSVPNDGYLSIFWGKNFSYKCSRCESKKTEPLEVTKIEKLILSGNLPFHWEIEGWRVSEVETKEMGRGCPGKISGLKTLPIIKWYSGKIDYLCQRCADRLKILGQEAKYTDYAIFKND